MIMTMSLTAETILKRGDSFHLGTEREEADGRSSSLEARSKKM